MTKLAVVIAFVAVFAAATAFAGEDAFIEESAESLIAELVSNAPAKQQQHGEASSVDFNNDREQMQTDKATEKLILDEIAAQWPERTKKTADVPSRKSKKARKGKRSEAALVEVEAEAAMTVDASEYERDMNAILRDLNHQHEPSVLITKAVHDNAQAISSAHLETRRAVNEVRASLKQLDDLFA